MPPKVPDPKRFALRVVLAYTLLQIVAPPRKYLPNLASPSAPWQPKN